MSTDILRIRNLLRMKVNLINKLTNLNEEKRHYIELLGEICVELNEKIMDIERLLHETNEAIKVLIDRQGINSSSSDSNGSGGE